jgi:hypothetical protein
MNHDASERSPQTGFIFLCVHFNQFCTMKHPITWFMQKGFQKDLNQFRHQQRCRAAVYGGGGCGSKTSQLSYKFCVKRLLLCCA